MCGFVGYENATIREYPNWIDGLAPFGRLSFQNWPNYVAYPAFGGDSNKRIPLLIEENGELKQVSAIWWFDVFVEQQQSFIGKRTSFNARNLSSPFWAGALNKSRGVVFASQIGESRLIGKTKHQYLMQSKAPFILGALFKKLSNGDYCCAIITRDAHPKMAPYHDKAFPFFLPLDAEFVSLWLGSEGASHPKIQALLNAPKLFPTLHVQRVKTYKSKQPVGNISATLISDVI